MDKKDTTYLPGKTSGHTKYRMEPPTTRSSRQVEKFEEEGLEILSDSESVTLAQQNLLGERLRVAKDNKKGEKREKMDTDGQLGKLLEMMITKQAESEEKNRELLQRLTRDRSTTTHGVDRVDLTRERSATYPKMVDKENMSTYLDKLEYSFTLNETQEARKCPILWSHLTSSACDKLMAAGPRPGETYASLKTKLIREFKVGYATAASEALKQINPETSIRETLKQKDQMLAVVAEGATTIPQALSCVSRMIVCSQLMESLVYELDTQVPDSHHTFHRKCEEWKDRQIPGTSLVKGTRKDSEKSSPYKLPEKFKCFTCGKLGHTTKYCRMNKPVLTQPESPDKKPIVCYNCREIGHKAPSCPKPKYEKPKRKEVKILKERKPSVKELQENEILVKVAGKEIPVTLDSGATITVLPKELVPDAWLTGKTIMGKGFGNNHKLTMQEANLTLTVAGKKMTTLGGVIPSKDINGTGVLSYRSTSNNKELKFPKLLEDALKRDDDDRLYLDYSSTTQKDQGVVLHSVDEGSTETDNDEGVDKEEEEDERSLGSMDEGSLVEEEGRLEEELENRDEVSGNTEEEREKHVSSEMQSDATNSEGIAVDDENMCTTTGDSCISVQDETDISCDDCIGDEKTPNLDIAIPKFTEENAILREHTLSDESLKVMRNLADKKQQGYSWKAGLIVRERLDDLGRVKRQIWVPKQQREKLMTLAHENFGHLARNSVVKHITKSFYWPTLWNDTRIHVQSCDTCQRVTKKNPKKVPMVAREIVTVPFERVSIDLVGPLPKSKGGFKYLFTYIDNASRWPEAEPLRSITAKSVIKAFEKICLRNGFPRTVISDNGTQFCSSDFKKFCKQHNIQEIKTSPYRPQSNGLVERMHATLSSMINKLSKTKQGFWHEITTLALYFIRMTPSSATGFSPYMIVHGWEPASPLEIVKEGLLHESLEDVDITTWVRENMERVETIADGIVEREISP